MSKICSLFGHRKLNVTAELEGKIENQIVYAIKKLNIDTFYLGNNGNFDFVCAKILANLKMKYTFIKSFLILPYLTKKYTNFEKEYMKKIFNSTIYPPLETVLPKFAILKRNEWMVNNSDYIIFYVEHNWGGAYKTLCFAVNKHKTYVNLAK